MNSAEDLLIGGVSPFGHPRINDRSHLPAAFRSVPRPSSPLGAKASTERPCHTHHRHPTPARSTKPRPSPNANSKPHSHSHNFNHSQIHLSKITRPGRVTETRRHRRGFWKHASRTAIQPRDTRRDDPRRPSQCDDLPLRRSGNRLRQSPTDFVSHHRCATKWRQPDSNR
jgi:hypothetical protein